MSSLQIQTKNLRENSTKKNLKCPKFSWHLYFTPPEGKFSFSTFAGRWLLNYAMKYNFRNRAIYWIDDAYSCSGPKWSVYLKTTVWILFCSQCIALHAAGLKMILYNKTILLFFLKKVFST